MQRSCYVITGIADKQGYIPSVCYENEMGSFPMVGFGDVWHWGKTIQEARAICAERNARSGLSEHDVIEITSSAKL